MQKYLIQFKNSKFFSIEVILHLMMIFLQGIVFCSNFLFKKFNWWYYVLSNSFYVLFFGFLVVAFAFLVLLYATKEVNYICLIMKCVAFALSVLSYRNFINAYDLADPDYLCRFIFAPFLLSDVLSIGILFAKNQKKINCEQ